MKNISKLLAIVFIGATVLTGCNKPKPPVNPVTPGDENPPVVSTPGDQQAQKPLNQFEDENGYLTKVGISKQLWEYSVDIYTNGKYKQFSKNKDGVYFISLNDMKNKLNMDVSKFLNWDTHKPCNMDKTAAVIDVDNVKGYDYKEYPISIEIYCD